jgi:predicted MFS family arabinose efflux permease
LTPLLVEYKNRFAFAPAMLNVAFAVYAAGFLVSVLVLGSLSDHVGRRPVLIGGLIVQLASNLVFFAAQDVNWVIAGRIVQGVASGAATAAFTAAMVEYAPKRNRKLGATLSSVTLTGGLALGSLLAGLAIQLTGNASTVIFTVLIALTIAGLLVAVFSRETGTVSRGAIRSMIPRISVPRPVRPEFLASAPVVAAVWMLAGLSGGLAPSMVHTVFGINAPFWGGFAGFVAPAVSVATGFAIAKVRSRTAMIVGIYASIAGSLVIIGGILLPSLPLMITGQAIAGIGFGSSFTAALQLLIPLVNPQQRAGLVAAVYVVAYAAFGIPIVAEGLVAEHTGDVPAVVGYTILTIAFAAASLIAQLRIQHRTK